MESFGEEKAVSEDPRSRRAGRPGQHEDTGQQVTGEGPPSRAAERPECVERSDRGKKEEGRF